MWYKWNYKFKKKDIINDLYESLFHLQHSGQDSCGINTSDHKKLYTVKGQGSVTVDYKVYKSWELKDRFNILQGLYKDKLEENDYNNHELIFGCVCEMVAECEHIITPTNI